MFSDIIPSPTDKDRVQCGLCAREQRADRQWFLRKNAGDHLQTEMHKRLLEAHEALARRAVAAERLASVREAEEIEALHVNIPSHASHPQASNGAGPSEAEQNMWDDYAQNGAEYHLEPDSAETPVTERLRLEQEAEAFKLWDASRAARELGFEDRGQGTGELDQEDDFLADLLENARRCFACGLEQACSPA